MGLFVSRPRKKQVSKVVVGWLESMGFCENVDMVNMVILRKYDSVGEADMAAPLLSRHVFDLITATLKLMIDAGCYAAD